MVKFIEKMTSVVFEEIPDKISLAVNITNCQNHCEGCHSSFLAMDFGEELTEDKIDELLMKQKGVNCFLFMGEGNDRERLLELNAYIKKNYKVETALYSGRKEVEPEYFSLFDYVKVGPYMKEYGPLNVKTTNQRLYYHGEDITWKIWKRYNKNC